MKQKGWDVKHLKMTGFNNNLLLKLYSQGRQIKNAIKLKPI